MGYEALPNRRIRLGRLETDAGRRDELHTYVPLLTEEQRENFKEIKDAMIESFQQLIRDGKELPTPQQNPGVVWLLIERLIDIAFNREQARLRDEARQNAREEIQRTLVKAGDDKTGGANETSSARSEGIQVARLPSAIACAK